ncbi:phage tail tape measure protein [Janibacter massiliensis]|uniref:hypothetical protein n=1 Tax=Janibacter massiliensis TaxID=2058291 RepID=UPI000D0F6CA5|nr:hypothetical protein [Janibacter massiliensis]
MAAKDLIFNIIARDRASKELDKVGDTAQKQGGKFDKLSAGADVALAAVGGAALTVGAASVRAASSTEQSLGGMQAVFKKNAGQIDAASKKAADSLGITRDEYLRLATVLGAGLKNKGIEDYAGSTEKLITIGGDLAAQFGGSTKESVEALASAMRGETDPIERYGVTMNATMIEAEAFAMGLAKPTKDLGKIKAAQNKAILAQRDYTEALREHGKGSDEALSAEAKLINAKSRLSKAMDGEKVQLTDQQKAQAALSLVTKQTADAHGAAARESGTLERQQAKLSASWEDTQAQLGQSLLPTVTKLVGALATVSSWMASNPGKVKVVVAALGVLTGVMLALKVATLAAAAAEGVASAAKLGGAAATGIATAAQWAWNAAAAAAAAMNPFAWIAVAVVAIVVMYKKVGWFREGVNKTFSFIVRAIKGFPLVFRFVVDKIKHYAGILKDAFMSVFKWTPMGLLITKWRPIMGFFKNLGTTISRGFRFALRGVARAWNGSIGKVGFTVPGWVPGVGGKSWSVPDMPVPALARGGIVSSPTLALIGEAGPEAVVPLHRGREFGLRPARPRDVPVEIPVVLDGRVLARAMARVSLADGRA